LVTTVSFLLSAEKETVVLSIEKSFRIFHIETTVIFSDQSEPHTFVRHTYYLFDCVIEVSTKPNNFIFGTRKIIFIK